MKQQSLASQGVFEKDGRKSRREQFLDEMAGMLPWSAARVLTTRGLATVFSLWIMLQTYFVQQWFNLSGSGVKEALNEAAALRRFVGVDLGLALAPGETTVLCFRHLLEKHDLGSLMLDAMNVHLEAHASASRPGPSWMRRSSMRLRRPRTRRRNAIRRCARPRRATSGTSG